LPSRTRKTPQEAKQTLQSLPAISQTMSTSKLCSALIEVLRAHFSNYILSQGAAGTPRVFHMLPTPCLHLQIIPMLSKAIFPNIILIITSSTAFFSCPVFSCVHSSCRLKLNYLRSKLTLNTIRKVANRSQ
jgi:hypothetical protein